MVKFSENIIQTALNITRGACESPQIKKRSENRFNTLDKSEIWKSHGTEQV